MMLTYRIALLSLSLLVFFFMGFTQVNAQNAEIYGHQVVSIKQIANINPVVYVRGWESHGKFIVFDSYDPDPTGNTAVWKVNPDGTDLRKLSKEELATLKLKENPSRWGDYVLYSPTGGYGNSGYVYIVPDDGSERQILCFVIGEVPKDPVISPDGRYVAFGALDAATNQQTGIYLIELSQPIPEFGYTSFIVLAISVFVIIIIPSISRRFTRIKCI